MSRKKNGNSTTGAGSRGEGRRFLSVPGMTEVVNIITPEIYDKIIAAGGTIGRPQMKPDGSVFLPVTGMKEKINITLTASEFAKLAKAAPKTARYSKNPATGKWEKRQ